MPSKSVQNPELKDGQIWRDNDPRANGRLLEIKMVFPVTVEVCSKSTGITTTIRKDRFARSSAKRGYSLVAEPAPTVANTPEA